MSKKNIALTTQMQTFSSRVAGKIRGKATCLIFGEHSEKTSKGVCHMTGTLGYYPFYITFGDKK